MKIIISNILNLAILLFAFVLPYRILHSFQDSILIMKDIQIQLLIVTYVPVFGSVF